MQNELPESTIGLMSTFMTKVLKEKKIAREFQERKHNDWNENYELYRNHVRTNRLTQRQAVNIPLMKETINTILSKIDDIPTVDWQEKSGDEEKEIIFQEMWNDWALRKNIEGIDVQDKKTALLYGRPHKKLNWKNGEVDIQACDPYDILIDPMVDPLDIETARFVIHQNIFRSLSEILANKKYSEEGRKKLETFLSTKDGIIQTLKNKDEWEKKMYRLRSMGVRLDELTRFGAGDVIINLTEQISNKWNPKTNKFEKEVVIYANDFVTLLEDSLDNLLGVDFYPYVTWTTDIETQDYFSDSIADIVRTPNKILNIWFSQMMENRTLQNFNMHWYDSTIQGYKPQTYEPGQGRMLPAPGDPNKTIMPVRVGGLDGGMESINFLTNIIERSTSATATEKGSLPLQKRTLGEIEIATAAANERTVTISKFYRRSWYELSVKWEKLMSSNSTKKFTLFKAGRSGKLYKKEVYPKDWKSEAGYLPTVRSTSEQEANNMKGIQKFLFVQQQFPNNKALVKIAQRRELEMLDLTTAELREIEEEEDKVQEMMQMQQQVEQTPQAVQTQQPQQPQQPEIDISGRVQELSSLLQ